MFKYWWMLRFSSKRLKKYLKGINMDSHNVFRDHFFLIKDLSFQLLTVIWKNDKGKMPEPSPNLQSEALQVGNQNYCICSINVCLLSCKI